MPIEQEMLVTEKEYQLIAHLASRGKDFIIDDTNTQKKYRDPLIAELRRLGVRLIGVQFYTDFEICVSRRKEQIDYESMARVYGTMELLEESEVDVLIRVL